MESLQKTSLLKGLVNQANNLFPGLVSTVLVDTPMATNPQTLVIYANYYTYVEAYMSTLSNLPIYEYIQDFNKVLICNHTSCATIESPKEMVRRS